MRGLARSKQAINEARLRSWWFWLPLLMRGGVNIDAAIVLHETKRTISDFILDAIVWGKV